MGHLCYVPRTVALDQIAITEDAVGPEVLEAVWAPRMLVVKGAMTRSCPTATRLMASLRRRCNGDCSDSPNLGTGFALCGYSVTIPGCPQALPCGRLSSARLWHLIGLCCSPHRVLRVRAGWGGRLHGGWNTAGQTGY